MSTNNQSSEEIDLGVLFNAINKFFKRILILCYRFIQFIIKSWVIILLLFIVGVIGGYFWQKHYTGNQEAELIVRTNYDSTSYVYNTIDQLNRSNYDQNKKKELPEISAIEIEPIVNIEYLFEGFENEMVVINLIENLQDKEGPYTPDAFNSKYKYHKITVLFSGKANEQSIPKLINYLGSHPLWKTVKDIGLENLKKKLIENEEMAKQVDEVLRKIASDGEMPSTNLTVLGGGNEIPLDLVLEFKRDVLEENAEIRENMVAQQQLVTLLNNPKLVKPRNVFSNKVTFFPLLLIFLYLFANFLRLTYIKIGRMANS